MQLKGNAVVQRYDETRAPARERETRRKGRRPGRTRRKIRNPFAGNKIGTKVKGHVAKLKEHVDEVKSLLKRKKCAHESLQFIQGQINMVQKSREVLEFLTELDQRHIPKLELLQDEIKFKQEEGQRSQASEMDFKTHIAILELLVKDMESERDIESLETPTLKMQFERHLEKVTNLLRSMKFVREKGKLEFHTLTLKLREHIVEMNSLLEKN